MSMKYGIVQFRRFKIEKSAFILPAPKKGCGVKAPWRLLSHQGGSCLSAARCRRYLKSRFYESFKYPFLNFPIFSALQGHHNFRMPLNPYGKLFIGKLYGFSHSV